MKSSLGQKRAARPAPEELLENQTEWLGPEPLTEIKLKNLGSDSIEADVSESNRFAVGNPSTVRRLEMLSGWKQEQSPSDPRLSQTGSDSPGAL